MRFFVTGDTAWPDERNYVGINRIALTKPVPTNRRTQMRKTNVTGNSLAYLLSQEQKRATADIRVVSKKTDVIGNSLAYLLSRTH